MTAPMPETMSPREKVARIVDPREWELQDFGAAKNGGQMIAGADLMLAPSLTKADAILAALASSGDHAELALMANAALEIYSDDVLVVGGTRRIHADNIILYVKNGVDALIAEVAALREREKAALKECSEWARQAGEAKGRLETSEAAGIVEGWRERATEAERKLAEAVEDKDAAVERLDTEINQHSDTTERLAEAVGLLREWMGTWFVDADSRGESAIADDTRKFLSKEAERG